MTAPAMVTPSRAKPNPFLSVQVALYKAGIGFTHCSPSFDRQRECWAQFWGAIQPTDFMQPVRMPGAQFCNVTPYAPGLDHTPVLFIEDEAECRSVYPEIFQDLFAVVATDGVHEPMVIYNNMVPSEIYNLQCEVKRLQGVVNGDVDRPDAY